MKITKILVALSFLFAVSTANAGELTVTGNMEATYTSEVDKTTGNPLGMDRELKFAGSTELDNGITVSVMQDTSDSLVYGNSKITFGNVAGMVDIYVGSDGSEVDAIDDITRIPDMCQTVCVLPNMFYIDTREMTFLLSLRASKYISVFEEGVLVIKGVLVDKGVFANEGVLDDKGLSLSKGSWSTQEPWLTKGSWLAKGSWLT